MADDCVICQKHRGEGPLGGQLIARRDGFVIFHATTDDEGRSPLGYVFIESDRHVPYLWDLTDEESASLGRLRTRLSRALRNELGAQLVVTAVIGLGLAHFHEHLIPRMPGTSLPWHQTAEALPRANASDVARLATRLAGLLEAD